MVREVRPDAVVHLAAYRDPEFCEEHPAEADALNVQPTRLFCEALPEEVPLVFVSSDYVFDGLNPPYTESDPVAPVNVYGRTKAESEALVLRRKSGTVLRVPLLVGAGANLDSSGFIGLIVKAVRQAGLQELDDGAIRFPTWTVDVAAVLAFVLQKKVEGIVHFTGLRGGTPYAWTREVADLMGASHSHIRPASGAPPSRRAPRPPNSQLAPGLLQSLGYDRFTDFADVVRHALRLLENC
jgi:dTDP-4-dehydrorhamnose reductase